jgi:hypothetical protein
MSGYLAGAKQFVLSEAGKTTPTLHCHGTQDPMVRFDMAQKTEAALKEAGHSKYEMKTYPIQHTLSQEEIVDAVKFLQEIVPADPTCDIVPKAAEEMSVKELKEAIRKGGLGRQAVGLTEKSELVKLVKDSQEK